MLSGTILVIRLSAMGDVALVLPTVRQAALQSKVVVVTKPLFSSFFENIDNVSIVVADTGGVNKGLSGFYLLFKKIRALHQVDAVLDLFISLDATDEPLAKARALADENIKGAT